ncbi:auxilin-like protein 1 [Argentina anserina]|uniref:auxilin-like protein 1 n=1 Tax=Argentina anserina TaxID=57926 RepID=UPI0021767128|nr:auxilin-like protein 1 [Potentilla anserina]
MDDSWRMRMGMPSVPGRHSGADRTSTRSVFPAYSGAAKIFEADVDFADVFGGPPRSVPRQSTGCSTSSFFEEIFRPVVVSTSEKSGRSLPEFRIPSRSAGFYSDIFGSDDEFQRRSRERSRPNSVAKSNSSSVLSSEELSPLRPVIRDDVALSSFASKLRPINVRWDSSTMKPAYKESHSEKQGIPAGVNCKSNENTYDEHTRASYFGFTRKALSPETISIEPSSFRSVKLSTEDLELLNSPSSEVSSICQEHDLHEAKTGILHDPVLPGLEVEVQKQEELDDEEEEEEEDDDDDDDEVMSSYVIEINSDHREGTCEEDNLEEAIAWAKEKFQSFSASEKESNMTAHDHNEQAIEMDEGRPNGDECSDQQRDAHEMTRTSEVLALQEYKNTTLIHIIIEVSELFTSSNNGEEKTWLGEDEKQHSDKDMELELLDEDVRLWSAGKESNIRMLLSTLHQILWPNSGWYATPLTSLIESSQVKKAYQKARLCLHPDKLQQRSATPAQKYVAEKAFCILQDAWSLFISQDVFIF